MANHKSALKRIRSNEVKRLRNRYQLTTARTLVKKLRRTTDKQAALTLLATITSKLGKLAKRNIIHKNKSASQQAKLTRFVNQLG